MATAETEALVAVLEHCAVALEHYDGRGGGLAPDRGSLPRLRPASGMPGAPTSGWFAAPADLEITEVTIQEVRELAAEFRDVALEVRAGTAGPGWINSVIGRASRFLDEHMITEVQAAARGYH